MKGVIFIFLLSFGNLFSQNSFYISPSIGGKSGISSTSYTQFSNKYPANDYFEIYNNTLSLPSNINFGIDIGWKNEKEKFMLDISWNQDEAGVSVTETYLSTNYQPNYYYDQNIKTKKSFFTQRFSANLSKPIIKDILFLKFGMGMIYSGNGYKKGKDYVSYTYSLAPFQHNENTIIGRTYSVAAISRFSFNMSLGLSVDMRWNKTYLFSLSAIYSHGFKKNILLGNYKYDITDLPSNTTTTLSYMSASRGSGLIFQISRRFQLYPWRPNKKVKEGIGL